jgi:hypothetical protein
VSRFLEQIRKVRLTEKPYRMALPGRLTTISHEATTVGAPPGATRFVIKAEIGASIMVADSQTGEVQLLEPARTMQRAIAHEVYGDVRSHIMELWPDVLELRNNPKTWKTSLRIEEKLNAILAAIEP